MNAHPAAELFPMMGDAEIAELAEDIKSHGLREPIKTLDGLILDGRNRYRACELAGVAPRFEAWRGEEPTAYVLSENLHRRHLTVSQIAAIGVEAMPLLEAEARERQRQAGVRYGRGVDSSSPNDDKLSKGRATEIASRQLGGAASPRTIQRAKAVKDAAPEVFEEIKRGEITVEAGLRKAELPTSTNGHRRVVTAKNRHKELVKVAETLVRIGERWERAMTDDLTPPQARKQLTVISKAQELLGEVAEAVEYRSATLHSYNV